MISMLCGREGQFTVQVGSKIMSWHTIRAVSVPPSKKRGYRCVQIFPRSTIPAETRRSTATITATETMRWRESSNSKESEFSRLGNPDESADEAFG